MKGTYLLLFSLWLTLYPGTSNVAALDFAKKEATVPKEASVWICNSKSAYAYHNSRTCSGLNRCKSDIISVKLSVAKSNGRKACKICY